MSAPIEFSNGTNTVKIYTTQVRGRPVHQVAYYRAGQRERCNFASLREARSQAKIILAQLAGATSEAAEAVTTPELESLVAARKALTGIDCPLHLAVESFANSIKALGLPQNPVTALSDAVAFYRKHNPAGAERLPITEVAQRFVDSRKRRGLSESYIDSVEIATNTFLKGFPNIGNELPSGNEVVQWLERKFKSPVTRNTNLRTLKTMAVWAKSQNIISHETISGVELWKEPAGEIEIYTPDEISRLLGGLPSVMVPQFAIGAFAGLRVAEAHRLDWSDINLERGFITVSASKAKTAARRLVPIQANLRAWLAPYARTSGEIAPFARTYPSEVVRLNKLPSKRNALRHSYISYRLAITPDAPRVALECGNSPEMIFQHYRELVTPEDAEAWFEIMPE